MIIIDKILTKHLWIVTVGIPWTPSPAKPPVITTDNNNDAIAIRKRGTFAKETKKGSHSLSIKNRDEVGVQ